MNNTACVLHFARTRRLSLTVRRDKLLLRSACPPLLERERNNYRFVRLFADDVHVAPAGP